MPRSKLKIKRPVPDLSMIEDAVSLIKDKKISINGASKQFRIPRTTLRRYYRIALIEGTSVQEIREHLAVKRVFNEEQNKLLVEYIKDAAILQFGLTLKDVRSLAYRFAKANKLKYPSKWDTEKLAGVNWLHGFRKRFKNEISLRKPEATSLARSSAFNKHTVGMTFTNYKKALSQCPPDLQAADVWNLDETGLSTVHVPPKILAPTGVKQVGSMTSAERGNTVTMIAACNAGGGFIPPMLIFPRVHYKDFMINGAPEGTLGAANPSGWSNERTFVMFMKHFIKFARPSKEHPIIVLMDNHESHISVEAIRLAKENGVILVTLHPHTSNKMQPLDKSVFGPFKTYFNQAANEKMMTPGHIGKPLTIYDIADLVGKAFPRAFTPTNIANGFKATGFHPLNENIFSDADFLAANVTDRPLPEEIPSQSDHLLPEQSSAQTADNSRLQESPGQVNLLPQEPYAQINAEKDQKLAQGSSEKAEKLSSVFKTPEKAEPSRLITPEMIRPHPKAAPRKGTQKGRQKGKSRILTDTPEKNAIEIVKKPKEVSLKGVCKVKKEKIKEKKKKIVEKVKRKVLVQSDSEDSNYSLHDTDDSCGAFGEDENSDCEIQEDNVNYETGDYVIFIYEQEYFVGKIESLNDEGALIKSMQKSLKNWKWPEKEDLNLYPYQDIKEKIKQPKNNNSKREVFHVPEMQKYWDYC